MSKRRKLSIFFCSYVTLLVIIGRWWYRKTIVVHLNLNEASQNANSVVTITLLDHTGFFGRPMTEQFGELLTQCPRTPRCILTSDRSQHNRSSAVIFHLTDMQSSDLPTFRSQEQIFVLFSFESPLNTDFNLTRLPKGFFNITISYRTDSDVWFPYGYFIRKSRTAAPSTANDGSAAGNGRKGTVWLVSNCETNSRREVYARTLSLFTHVDIVGGCADSHEQANCPKNQWRHCEKKLLGRYKFYLAFENSVCRDYATEKFFARLADGLVPIVLRRSDLSAYAPPRKSFVAADDFANAQQLAAYLNYLDLNNTAYAEYHAWRAHFEVHSGFLSSAHHFCKLCAVLADMTQKKKELRLHDAHKWWYTDGGCIPHFSETLL